MRGGRMILTTAGAPASQTNAVSGADAVAGFVSDTITWDRWSLSPGIRYESIDLERLDYAGNDPSRTAPTRVRTGSVNVAVPGLGVGYLARPGVSLFGGVHRGFAPPGPGADTQTEAEDSINYEIGARVGGGALRTEVVGFFNDYSNLLGRDTLSAGGTGEGDLFNGGEARVYGLELSGEWNALEGRGSAFAVPVRVAYTFTTAEFRNSFSSQFGPWGTVAVGDELPYVPRQQAFVSVDLDRRIWRARLDASYVGRMRTVAGQGAIDPAAATDAYAVLGLSGEYTLGTGASLFASVQNLTDRRYLVSRHPQGARPGLPRTAMVGLRFLVGR
jgi:Fe(3+) dicitrate transport protein